MDRNQEQVELLTRLAEAKIEADEAAAAAARAARAQRDAELAVARTYGTVAANSPVSVAVGDKVVTITQHGTSRAADFTLVVSEAAFVGASA